jgi:RsiW-degrading membrane proteinase PrsW (M82 family)
MIKRDKNKNKKFYRISYISLIVTFLLVYADRNKFYTPNKM